jgi:hypothetical protein
VREREDANRTREAGHLDEIQGVAANTLNLFRNGAVGFIVWLDPLAWLVCVHKLTDDVPFFGSVWMNNSPIHDL